MLSHEKAEWLLRIVYQEGIDRAKAILSEQQRSGDKQARALCNVLGLYEQGSCDTPDPSIFGTVGEQTFPNRQIAGAVQEVMKDRRQALRASYLVNEVIDGRISTEAAISTLA